MDKTEGEKDNTIRKLHGGKLRLRWSCDTLQILLIAGTSPSNGTLNVATPLHLLLDAGQNNPKCNAGDLDLPQQISLLVVFIAESEGQEAEEFYCSHLSRISYVVMTVVSPGKCHDCSAS